MLVTYWNLCLYLFYLPNHEVRAYLNGIQFFGLSFGQPVSLSVCLSICWSVCISICQSCFHKISENTLNQYFFLLCNHVLYIHSFVCSFIYLLIDSFIHSIHLFIHSCIHSFIHSFIHLFIHSFHRVYISINWAFLFQVASVTTLTRATEDTLLISNVLG